MVRARRLARDREQCVFFDCAVCLSSRFGFLLSLVDFFRRSALRVSPAETRLTVYRRLVHSTGAVSIGRQIGQRRSMIFDVFFICFVDVLIVVSNSVTFNLLFVL